MRGSGVAMGSEFWERSAAGQVKDTVTLSKSTRAQPQAPEERSWLLVVLPKYTGDSDPEGMPSFSWRPVALSNGAMRPGLKASSAHGRQFSRKE